MQFSSMIFILAFAISLSACLGILWTRQFHGRYSADSTKGVQKIHHGSVPRIGGIAILGGLLASLGQTQPDSTLAEVGEIITFLALASLPAFILGLMEDITKQISPFIRLLATLSSGLLGFWISGVVIQHSGMELLDNLLSLSVLSVFVTAFSVAAMANAINMIDGLNGLAAGVVITLAAVLGLVAGHHGDHVLAMVCFVLAAAVAGFLVFNWPLGKIFLGDGGAYMLGVMLAWLAILLVDRNPAISQLQTLLLFLYPAFEITISILRRMLGFSSPFRADHYHLHSMVFRFMDAGLSSGPNIAAASAMANNLVGLMLVILHGLAISGIAWVIVFSSP